MLGEHDGVVLLKATINTVGKDKFIKNYVSRCEHTSSGWIVASITLGVVGIAQEDARNRTWCKLVWCSGSGVRKTPAAKHGSQAPRRREGRKE